jgi:hypothetical protein
LPSRKLYWLCQGLGWTLYSCFYFYSNSVGYIDSFGKAALYCIILITAGILLTGIYRRLVIRLGWNDLPIKKLLPRVLAGVLIMASLMTVVNLLIERETFPQFVQDITPILLVRYGSSWLELFLIYTFIYHLYGYYRRSLVAEKARASAEFDILRSQIHPHFYFNTLNNLYGLAQRGSPRTGGIILMLASIMEYIIYDCRSETVALQKEIHFIRSYVELERLRHEEDTDIRLLDEIPEEISGLQIAPLLLIPFVENAFKHGMAKLPGNQGIGVFIRIGIEKDRFCFEVVNETRAVVSRPGVGLDNVRKRLDHLYPGRHWLEAGRERNLFKVRLYIEIKCLSNAS